MEKSKQRIELTDSLFGIAQKMSEGNPGALTVVLELCAPNGPGDLGHILDLDREGIYAHRIWMLFKYVCEQNYQTMVNVLDAQRRGKISGADLNYAIDHMGKGIDIKEYR